VRNYGRQNKKNSAGATESGQVQGHTHGGGDTAYRARHTFGQNRLRAGGTSVFSVF